ncbi:c-type cytochrome [Deinococcus radiopugnans]|uniref:Cytochrome c4 n=1 Tax=Deinococcus radiopugnans ATCC 19172 TaxID=585398 RepID=A0A5C4Y200_9DEIO|nr:cytochrome c4 [Deinococcus radiopugnans]MBB6017909.1 cytochrome c553 [Deinococcus radiopugnans ATCC 19172]TNM68968.1 cytochrome c4 [Deinococcus radiopugnans ATCC 19172]
MQRTVRFSLWLAVPLALFVPAISALAQSGTAAKPAVPAKNPLALTFKKPDPAKGKALSQSCQGCHGPNLASTNKAIPGLAGQNPSYTRLQLAAFRAKLRPSQVMWQQAANLSDQDIADIAAYAGGLKPGSAWKVGDEKVRAKGEALFHKGDSGRNIIACAICHGDNGRGNDYLGVASITNLSPEYGLAILKEFKGAPGFGVPHPDAMRIMLRPMTDADLKAVAAYISSMQK